MIQNTGSNRITIMETRSGHIYVDIERSILNLNIKNDKYNNEEFENLCMVFQKFIEEAYNNKKKYYLLWHTKNIGMYPLTCYTKIKDMLESLKPKLEVVIHATCLIVEPDFGSHILKFFFNIYKPLRPASVIHDIEESYSFFAKPECQNMVQFS